MENLSDSYYISHILKGDTSCYAYLLNKYSRQIFTLVYKIVGNREDAEELTQDVFVKAFQKLDSLDEYNNFSNWIYKIAYNLSISSARRNKVEILAIDEFQLNNAQDCDIEAEREDDELLKQKLAILDWAMSLISVEDRALILLFYKGRKSLEDIASISGISIANVKVRLHRIRKKLYVIISDRMKNINRE